jgi:chaperone required for assembly of F1-ATPase
MSVLRKRFYQQATASAAEGGYAILLDGKSVKTPKRRSIIVPTQSLADAVAAEWQAQDEHINPDTMPLTRIATITLDLVADNRELLTTEMLDYIDTDLLCYHSDKPVLRERQQQEWGRVLERVNEHLGAALQVTQNIMPVTQPAAAHAKCRQIIDAMNLWQLSAFILAVKATGSFFLGLAMYEGWFDLDVLHRAAQLDEIFQAEEWGMDPEMTRKSEECRSEVEQVMRFLALLH